MKKPAVTIAIPCFNAARWIGAAIQSALDQTWREKEIIVVDDGSTDGSVEAVRAFGRKVMLLQTEHRGANHARNAALKTARGEWVQFLDADDYLEPQKIEWQFAETLEGAVADVIYSPVWWETWREDQTVGRYTAALDASRDLYTQWLTWELPQTGGALWRKTALDQLGGWKMDQPCCQEHELYARALCAGLRFVFAPTPHAVYRLWSDGTLCRRDPSLVIEVKTRLIDEFRAGLRARSLWTGVHQAAAAQACFEMARTFAKYDLAKAAAYHHQRKQAGLIATTGPAAPSAYRLFYHLVGFQAAERVARMSQPFRQPS